MIKFRRWLAQLIRLCLNWGILIGLVAAVLAVRYDADAVARTPLAVPLVRLPAAEARQWQAFPTYTRTVPVLLYHGINTSNDYLSVSRQSFAAQMLALRIAGFHTITLSQYVKFVQNSRAVLPAKPILITFDDGRLDAYRGAENVLHKYGLHATMFTFAGWAVTNPGFNLGWSQLASMQRSGIWSVQEHGGSGHEYVAYNARGTRGGVFAFRRYLPGPSGHGGRLESFSAFVRRVTSNILWGKHQFATQLPGYRPVAFAVPEANYGQEQTNDARIPQFTLPWLKQHFAVVFGGDYLDQGRGRRFEIRDRFSHALSYRITMGTRMSLPALFCRLKDWVTGAPMWHEYRCLRLGRDIEGQHPGWEDRHERASASEPGAATPFAPRGAPAVTR